jgi:hypothetical protein
VKRALVLRASLWSALAALVGAVLWAKSYYETGWPPVSAKDYGGLLERNGFVEVPSAGYTPQPGDTAVFDSYAGGSAHGHVQGYTGNGPSGWVSDFRQPRFWASRGYEGANSFKIYRPTDTGSTAGGGCSCK